MTDPLTVNTTRLTAATETGIPFHVGVSLSYVGGGSDKFWTAVWADTRIAVNFGPHMTPGQALLHDFDSREKAANRMWALLREKYGKGYSLVDAAFLVVDDTAIQTHYDVEIARQMVAQWTTLRRARKVNSMRLPFEPDHVRSPRTGRQGGQVLLAISDPHADHDTLVAAWDSAASEKFLPPLVLSHPACPEEARFMAALSGTKVP